MLFKNIGVIDADFNYLPNQYVGVAGDTIAYLGSEPPAADYGETYDGTGKVMLPGLVNAHSHAPMTLMRGYAENLALDDWLNTMIFPFEAQMTDAEVYPATLLAIAEMLRFGTTSFSDMYYFSDTRARAILESGIKCNMCDTLVDFSGAPYDELPIAQMNKHLHESYHGANGGRLLVDWGLHAEYTSNPTVVRGFAASAREMGARVHVHVSETRKEVEECKERHNGMTPPAYLADLGVFDSPTLAAHCVWLEEGDYELLSRYGVTVASNPISNAKLGSGIANVRALQAAGVRIAVGTDSVASNNNLDMWQDMNALALLERARDCNPVGISPAETLRCATRNGALAQGRDNTGLIAEGMRADLCIVKADDPWMCPASDMVTNLVYSTRGSDVVMTMVDGQVLYRDGVWPTIDVERVMHDVVAARDAVLARL